MTTTLTEFTLTNFKSYREARFPLGPLTLLIGANASGKSNAIEALKILSCIDLHPNALTVLRYPQYEKLVRGHGNDLFYRGGIGCQIDCRFNGIVPSHLALRLTTDTLIREIVYSVIHEEGFFSPDSSQITPAQVLKNILFLDSVPSKMRDYSFKHETHLYSDGSNLSSVLYQICQTHDQKQIILDLIRSLPEEPITTIDFIETPRDEVMLTFTETLGNSERDYDVGLLSDGTLRVLAIAAALLSAPEGSLIVIEEIDNGVHPSRAQQLLANIRDIADRRNLRVLLSTHNPALMDALPDAALSDVVFCYRDPQDGDSRLTRLGDIDNFPGLVSQGPLGHLVTTGVVDRFVKHPTTPEERKQKALTWLREFEEMA
jgi:AAA domain, putative AbiEii toxin, Type IV TA system